MHLIKGKPAVHGDKDLIVCHISVMVEDMVGLKEKLDLMGIESRKNISVPDPTKANLESGGKPSVAQVKEKKRIF